MNGLNGHNHVFGKKVFTEHRGNCRQEIQTKTIIHSTPRKIWPVLTDFDKYPEWNPFVRSMAGHKKIGAQLTMTIQPPSGKAMTFKPSILNFDAHREFRWLGKLFIKGLF